MIQHRHNHFRRLLALVAACTLVGLPRMAAATPYWTPEQIHDEFVRSHAAAEPRWPLPHPRERTTLDQIAYFQHYRMLCDFLVSLQFTGAGVNHGGMIEGESGSDHDIIQTDNTQEAIRVWSRYAIWTGDTARYGGNIRLAQGYCGRFPAWREEGGGYYAAHNCGWGFEAERLYRQAYGDTSWTWYADSCAWWTTRNALPFDPNSTDLGQLEPLAEGLAIGGLYPHAIYRGRNDWQSFALTQARRLRRWFESNPARLNANEVWALCGGTALWGVCESLFEQYPDSGQMWLAQYGSQLDAWESVGQWNHSFCAWYCNAQHVCFEITGDSSYWNNAVFITDSLIGLDTDHDGGIPPGRSFPVTNDHSWVSAYMGWMGMERIINRQPAHDVAAVGFVSPDSLLPHMAGDALTIRVRVANNGWTSRSAQVRVLGPSYADSMTVALAAGADSTVALAALWTLPNDTAFHDRIPLVLTVHADSDLVSSNDSVVSRFDIRNGVRVTGVVLGGGVEPVPARVEFYHESYPDCVWTSVETPTGSFAIEPPQRLPMAGLNRVRATASIRYVVTDVSTQLDYGPEPVHIEVSLPQTVVALIDDDAGDRFESYYQVSLDSLRLPVRTWSVAESSRPDLAEIPTVVWFTGNDSTTTLDSADQASLTDYLSTGGHLILTGQNITDDLGPASQFLNTVLRCSSLTNTTSARRIQGTPGDPLGGGVDMYVIGTGGAQNQFSPSSITVLPGATEILHYTTAGLQACGASGSYGNGRFVFLSFGLEAVSGASHTMTRRGFLERCFAWFGDSLSAASPAAAVPATVLLEPNFPNPFNPSTTIRFIAPIHERRVSLVIYNLLGQTVRTLYDGPGMGGMQTLIWDGSTATGAPAASGVYICRLRTGTAMQSRTLQLIR